ncbi:MAG TPA: glycosyltransferase family 4 protein [Blastocatellia bacterium]|nr:glycosyltransferase family 4 protein [Blastocatellia bacterium]
MTNGKRRCLVLTSELNTCGGIQRYTRHLIRCLREIYGTDAVRSVSLLARSPRNGCATTPTLLDKMAFSFQSLHEAIRWRPQAIVCNHIGLAPVAIALKRMMKVPYVVLTHGDDVWRPVSRCQWEQAAMLVSVSQYTARFLCERRGVEVEKVWIIPAALDPELIASPVTEEDVVARHRLAGKRVLLTVSRLDSQSRYKGHEQVFRALAKIRRHLPPCVYLVVGTGNDRTYLERRAAEFGLGDIVVFTGAVEDNLLPAYYRACDVFIMPSLTDCEKMVGEGFGIAYIEAAAFGRPAIAGRGGGATEAVLDGVTGLLVDPQSVDEIAQAILTLLTNDDLRQRLGEQARARAQREFTFDRFRQQVADLFTVLFAEGSGA